MQYSIIQTGSKGNAIVAENEVWKDVEDWEGIYQISNLGRLKSFKQYASGKILKQTNKKGDYFSVILQKDEKNKSTRIHRLVAKAFIPNPQNLPQVNHIDGNKQNNNVSNLEWCTHKQNAAHARKMYPQIIERMVLHNKYISSKPVIQFTQAGERVCWYISSEEAGKATGICSRNIHQVASKTPFNSKGQCRKTAGGYVWKFESEVI